MDNTAAFNDPPRPVSGVQRVIRASKSFEAAWRAGEHPRIEQYLGQTEEPESSFLLHHLVAAELELRRKGGEKPAPQEYLQRFPDHSDLIEDAFHSAPHRQSHELEADVQIGDFKIVKRLGAGGMGIVYLARQVSLNRMVALKILGPSLTQPADKARFLREAQAVAKLKYPGIASVYYIGQDDHLCYYAMEYVDGISLRAVIENLRTSCDPQLSLETALHPSWTVDSSSEAIRFDDPTEPHEPESTGRHRCYGPEELSPEASRLAQTKPYIRRCCQIAKAIALALAHAHERGVIHRDIKPENILLDRHGNVYLIDFGLARFFEDATVTQLGALVGTPTYMSPEQVTGRLPADYRTDIYSLGLVLYELLSLRRPIVAPTRESILRYVIAKPMPPVSWKNEAVSRLLEAIVHKSIEKDPDERYQSATEFAKDLEIYLDGGLPTAHPYRYKFDYREIIAERPFYVILAAYILFFSGVLFSVGLGGIVWEAKLDNKFITYALRMVPFIFMCWFYYFLVWQFVRGTKRARTVASWCSNFFLAMPALTLILYSVAYLQSNIDVDKQIYKSHILVFGTWALVCLSVKLLLRQRSVVRWFKFAKAIYAEHEHQRASAH